MRADHVAGVVAAALLGALGSGCGSSSPAEQPPAGQNPPPPQLNTGYPGDELALPPPDPSEGFQLHYGPEEYTEEGMADYLLGPGEEDENCFNTVTPNEEEVFIGSYKGHMRPGSHHLIVWALDQELTEGLGFCPFNRDRFLVGSQSPTIEIADGDEGFALRLAPRTPVAIDLHYLNTTPDTILREAWVNVGYMNPADVKYVTEPITSLDIGIAVPPLSTHVEHSECEAPGDVKIRMLTGHMHQRGVRISAWVNTGGERRLVYEAYDWGHPGNLYYKPGVENPAPDPVKRITGGASGEISLKAGDKVEWECEYNNPTDQEYNFGDSAQTDEMCNIFGIYYPSTGDNWRCIAF